MTTAELAVQDRRGIDIGARCGFDRVEVCSALELGGLTPSAGTVAYAVDRRDAGGAAVHVLVRPRAGGFVYDPDDVAASLADIEFARRAGADGVVVGASDVAGSLDERALTQFVDAARGMEVTVHRVVDVAADTREAVRAAARAGATRVLTSGGAESASEGLATLAELVAEHRGTLQIMAGAGVTVDDIPRLLAAGVDSIHVSAKRFEPDPLLVSLGVASGASGAGRWTTDETVAREVRAAVDRARPARSSSGDADGLGDRSPR